MITSFRCYHSIFLKWAWRESVCHVCHVSLGKPSHVPNHPGIELEVQIHSLDWASTGAHQQEPATTPYSYHGVFTDRSILSLNLSRIQIPTGTSVSNCNRKHRLTLTCRYDVDIFTSGRVVLSLPKRAHVDSNWPISRKKYLKIDWSVKMLLHWPTMEVAGS